MFFTSGVQLLFTALSVAYQVNRQRKLKQAADARLGLKFNSKGEVVSLPVLYGLNKVGGNVVFAKTLGSYTHSTAVPFSTSRSLLPVIEQRSWLNPSEDTSGTVRLFNQGVWRRNSAAAPGSISASINHSLYYEYLGPYSDYVLGLNNVTDAQVTAAGINDATPAGLMKRLGWGTVPTSHSTSSNSMRFSPSTHSDVKWVYARGLNASTSPGKNSILFVEQALSAGEISEVITATVDGKPIDSEDYNYGIRVQVSPKTRAATDPMILANFPTRTNSLFTNMSSAAMCFYLNRSEAQYSGIPQVEFIVKGQPVRDIVFSNGNYSFSTSRSYSNNFSLVLADYLTSTVYGRGLPDSSLHLESFYNAKLVSSIAPIASATFSSYNAMARSSSILRLDQTITGPVYLFEANIALDTGDSVWDNIEQLMALTNDGALLWSDGKYKLMLEYPMTGPQQEALVRATYTDNHLVMSGGFSKVYPSQDTKLNQVSVSFPNGNREFREDVRTWPDTNSTLHNTFLSQDNGSLLSSSLTARGCLDPYTAQAIAEQTVRESRGSVFVEFELNSVAFELEIGDLIRMSFQSQGLNQVARVVGLEVTQNFTTRIKAVYYDYQNLAWNVDDDQPGSGTARVVSFIPGVSSLLFNPNQSGSQLVTSGTLSWSYSGSTSGVQFIVELSENLGSSWYTLGTTSANSFSIASLKQGDYLFRVTAILDDGKKSQPTLLGFAQPGFSAPASMSVSERSSGWFLTWPAVLDPRVTGYLVTTSTGTEVARTSATMTPLLGYDNQTVTFRVYSLANNETSSNFASLTVNTSSLPAPSGFAVAPGPSDAATASLAVTWNSSYSTVPVNGVDYEIRVNGTTPTNPLSGSFLQFSAGYGLITGLDPSTNYQVRMRFRRSAGSSFGWSNWFSATSPAVYPVIDPASLDFTGLVDEDYFADGVVPIILVNTLPTSGNFEGRIALLSTDGNLYRYTSGAWSLAFNLTGQVNEASFAAGVAPIVRVTSLPTTGNYAGRIVFLTTDNKLYRHTGSPTGSAGFVANVAATDLSGQITGNQIQDAAITAAKFANGIEPVEILATLPTTGNFAGRVVFLTTDNKLYRHTGSPTGSAGFTASVPANDISGQLAASQIAALEASKITGQLNNSQLADLAATKITGQLSDAQLSAISAAKISGQLTDAQITSIAAAKLTGQVSESQIADSAISATKFASGLRPIELLSALPTTGNTAGRMVFLTTDNKLYRHTGSPTGSAGFVATIPATDISGQLAASQIAAIEASKITGQLNNNQIAEVAAAKVSGQLTDAQIAAIAAAKVTGQITSLQLQDGAVSTAKLANGLRPIEIVSALPTTGNTAGRMVFLTTDNKLYRHTGSPTGSAGFVSTVAAADISGTVSAAQITSLAASQITGQLSDAQLASISAAKLTGQITGPQIQDAAITLAKFGNGLEPVEIMATLPTTGNFAGRMVFLTTDNKLYRHTGSPTGSAGFISSVASSDISGQLTASQIASLAASQITGQLNDSQLASISAAKLTGQITGPQLQDASVSITKFANGIEPVEIMATLPTTGNFAGRMVFLTTDNKLYRHTGSPTGSAGFVSSIAATDISGQLTAAQISSLAASQITGQLSDAQLASISAAKLSGTITETQISDNSISSGKIQAGAVIASKIAAGAVEADKIAANAVTAASIQAGAVETAKLAVGAVTANQIAANAVTAGAIQAGSVIAGKIAAGAVSATEVATNAITSDKIQAGAVTAAKLQAGSVEADKIAANAVTAVKIQAGAVETAKLAVGAVTADQLATNAVTAVKIQAGAVETAKLAVGAVTANQIATDAVTAVKIQAGAVETAKLAVGAVTADQIATNAVTAVKIQAGAVETAKLAVGAVTADQIATNAVTAVKIQAGAVETAKIAAGAVDADRIAANAVTAAKIQTGAIEADKLAANSVVAGKIAAGAVNATELAAGSVLASKLVVSDQSNLFPDYDVRDVSFYNSSVSWGILEGSSLLEGEQVISLSADGSLFSSWFPIAPSADFAVRAVTRSGTAAANRIGTVFIELGSHSTPGVTVPTRQVQVVTTNSSTSLEGTINVTTTSNEDRFRFVLVRSGGSVGSSVRMGGCRVTRRANAALIVDGAIIASKLQTGSVETDKLAAGAVNADKIAANAVTAVKIQAGAVETAKIATGAVTADQIGANAVTAVKIQAGAVEAAKIAAGAVEADKIATNAVTADKIAANAVTSDKIQANSVISGKVAAGAISATEIASGSISARHLVVRDFTELSGNPNFENGLEIWSIGAGAEAQVTTWTNTTPGLPAGFPVNSGVQLALRTATPNTNLWIPTSIPALEGDKFYISAKIARKGATGEFRFQVQQTLNTGGSNFFTIATTPASVTNEVWSDMVGIYTVPAGVNRIRFYFQTPFASGATGSWFVTNLAIRKAVDANLIVDGSVIASKLATNSVTTNSIQAGAVTADQIATNAVTAVKIQAGAIEAAKIATGAIEADKVAANAVKTVAIEAGAVTTDRIAVGAVTADRIAANTITAGQIQAGSIDTASLAVGAVSALTIATGAVTADKIQANAVTTDKLEANSVTTGKIQAGAITASQLAANSVTASKLFVGDTSNVFPDPLLVDVSTSTWGVEGLTPSDYFLPEAGVTVGFSTNTLRIRGGVAATGYLVSPSFSVEAGRSYFVSVWAGAVNDGPSTNCTSQVFVRWFNGTTLLNEVLVGSTTLTQSTITAPSISGQLVAPATATAARLVFGRVGNSAHDAARFTAPVVRPAVSGELVVDGAITTLKLAAGSVATDRLQAGSVTSTVLAAGAVTADRIQAGAVSAAAIASGAITASKIAIGDATNLFPDFDMLDTGFYNSTVSWGLFTSTSVSIGDRAAGLNADGTLFTSWCPVEAGIDIRVGGVTYNGTAAANRTGTLFIEFGNIDEGVVTTTRAVQIQTRTNSTSTARTDVDITLASNENRFRFYLVRSGGTSGSTVRMGALKVLKRARGELIVDGAITANKLAANSVTAGKIQAGAITASKLSVRGSANLVYNGGFELDTIGGAEDINSYSAVALSVQWLDAVAGGFTPRTGRALRIRGFGAISANARVTFGSISVQPGDTYAVEGWVSRGSTAHTTGDSELVLAWYDAASALISESKVILANSSLTTSYQRMSGQLTAPANAVFAQFLFRPHSTTVTLPGDRDWIVDDFSVKLASGADLIVNGSITADKLESTEISSMFATIGTLSSAVSGERVVISDDQITIYDASNTVRVRLGFLG